MTAGRIMAILIGCVILAVVSGIVTRNLFIAIAFPFLLVVFIVMWSILKKEMPEEPKEEPEENDSEPPVSTNYPKEQ
jgi:choline-glycine betaine transporter